MTEPRAANSLVVWVFCWDIQQKDEAESEDDEQPSSAERKEHSADGQTGEQNIQSDSAVELAGAAAETDQAKEVKVHPAACPRLGQISTSFSHFGIQHENSLHSGQLGTQIISTHVHLFKVKHIWFFYS